MAWLVPGALRVLVRDSALVQAGVEIRLAAYRERVCVLPPPAAGWPGTAGVDASGPDWDADVLLYGEDLGRTSLLTSLAAAVGSGVPVMVFSWDVHPALVQQALHAGASGFVSKAVRAPDLVSALERVAAGEQVVPDDRPC